MPRAKLSNETGWRGMESAKWLQSQPVSAEPFQWWETHNGRWPTYCAASLCDSPSPKTPWPNFNMYTLCAIMYLLVGYGWAGIWLNIAQDDLLQTLCLTIIICQNVTWKRQNECTEIANNFSCRAQQKELDAKWSIWILHKSGWTSSGALVFVSSSEKNPDFIHNAFIVLTPALIVPNNALQPKRKATLDTSAFSNSSICWTLALVIQSACLYATQSRQEPQHVHFKSTDSK